MCVRKRMLLLGLAAGLVLSGAVSPARADDLDGDAVDDTSDVCNNTPEGIPIDAEGRPVGDIDLDCDVDLDDFALFQQGMTDPLPPVGACCSPDGTCIEVMDSDCGGIWQGAGSQCTPNPCIPPNMVMVPAGEFEMGDSFGEFTANELPVHVVHLRTYWIDKYEVTNQQYAAALNWAGAQGGLIEVTVDGVVKKAGDTEEYCDTTIAAPSSRITWNGSTFGVVSGKEDHPMVYVTWYGAAAFSNWKSSMEGRTPCYNLNTWACDFGRDGYHLPTEAEWEKAAGWDPVQNRHFRFSEHTDGCGLNCLDGQRANFYNSGDPYDVGSQPWTTPVGFYDGSLHHKVDFGWPSSATSYQTHDAQSYYGCRDMTGNAREWCHEWYDAAYYSSSPSQNPTGPTSGPGRVYRGGYWFYTPNTCRSATRGFVPPESRYNDGGFRCAAGTP